MSGKGDGYRPVDLEKFASNWDRIFANKVDSKTVDQEPKAPDRCPNTIDIEEQLEDDRRKSAEVGGSSDEGWRKSLKSLKGNR